MKGEHAAAALYWRGYALNKLSQPRRRAEVAGCSRGAGVSAEPLA